jgi:hypothetical protein
MYKDEENAMVSFRRDTLPFDAIPLYTHPADLTDEEIKELWFRECSFTTGDLLKFARAILKKASEK